MGKTCFVIIGYGPKTSYANGKIRELNLDETYEDLIEPVFKELNIDCYRAVDKNLTGSIDKLMLEEIKNADIALVDISTLNSNVMWELGVRHALKPHHTIIICEKAQMSELPFDINHFPIHAYAHTEEGIPNREVKRFKEHLTMVVKGIINQNPIQIDSPVHTFLNIGSSANIEIASDSFASIIDKAESAKDKKDYTTALNQLAVAKEHALRNMTFKGSLSFIISRQALCTYKSKQPTEPEALLEAENILEELKPYESQDIEVLGLSGAISKRLYEITSNNDYLNRSIHFYEEGFRLKKDYYNGINAAFMLYMKASQLRSEQIEEWEDIKIDADSIRNRVLKISLNIEKKEDFSESKDPVWVLFTIAEAYNYKKNNDKQLEYENKALALANTKKDTFAPTSYEEKEVE